jgi:hypothetical protein
VPGQVSSLSEMALVSAAAADSSTGTSVLASATIASRIKSMNLAEMMKLFDKIVEGIGTLRSQTLP